MDTATQTAATATVTAPDAYVTYFSRYERKYSAVKIVSRTATKMVVRSVNATSDQFDATFTLRKSGEWLESTKTPSFRERSLEFNILHVQEVLAERAATAARNHKARELRDSFADAARKHFNGFGDYCGGDEGIARMQAALDILNGVDDVH